MMISIFKIVISLGIGATIMFFVLWIYPKLSAKKVNYSRYTNYANDGFDRWINMVEHKIHKANARINTKFFTGLSVICAAVAFAAGLKLFSNLTAAIFFSASLFLVPDQVLHAMIVRRKQKKLNQLAMAIRVFSSEYMYSFSLEKSCAAVASQVSEPIGGIFRKAHRKLLVGFETDSVLAELAADIDNEYGSLFIQVLRKAQQDTETAVLFNEIAAKIEEQRTMERKNHTLLAAERVSTYLIVLMPIPVYLWMQKLIPETKAFVVETFWGRVALAGVFVSIFVWCLMERVMGGVEG